MRVFLHRDYESEGVGELEVGDIRITSKMDGEGRKAAAGRHTNYGYSGYVIIMIWDGNMWAKLNNRLLPDYCFQTQKEGNAMIRQLAAMLEQKAEKGDVRFSFWWYKWKRYGKIKGLTDPAGQ